MTKEERREYQREWRIKRKEHLIEYEANRKESRKEYNKQWREENKERLREYDKEYGKAYYIAHKEEISSKNKRYREENAEKLKEYHSNRHLKEYETKEGRAKFKEMHYRQKDQKKNFDTSNNITAKWILENIFNSQCHYCGKNDWNVLVADRIDNNKGHTPDNCICACINCNAERADRYSVEEFVAIKKKEKGGD